jgi:magnesium-transporting ATPase (P-type)
VSIARGEARADLRAAMDFTRGITNAASESSVERPQLLTLIMAVATLFALAFGFAAVTLSRENHGLMINYKGVSGEQFLMRARAVVIVCSIVAAYLGIIAFTLRGRFSSSRVLLLAYLPIACLACVAIFLQILRTPRFVDFIGLIFFAILGTPVAYWYLYRKSNVVAYYQAIDGPGPTKPS